MTKTSIVLMMAALLLLSPLAQAQEEAHLYLQPLQPEGSRLVLEVIAENVTDLYGAEFRLTYDPASLSVQDLNINQEGLQIQAGTLLPENSGLVVANEVDEQAGVITFAMTLLNPAPAVTGSGPLARIAFNVLQANPSTIEIAHARLIAANLQTIPSQTRGIVLSPEAAGVATDGDGSTANSPATEISSPAFAVSFPWWIVAAAIIVLGSLTFGALIMWGTPKATQVTSMSATARPIKRQYTPASGTSGSRPSAFKQQTFSPDEPGKDA